MGIFMSVLLLIQNASLFKLWLSSVRSSLLAGLIPSLFPSTSVCWDTNDHHITWFESKKVIASVTSSVCSFLFWISWLLHENDRSRRQTYHDVLCVAPQLWQAAYKPRNILPWSIITGCYVSSASMLIGMRIYLHRINTQRSELGFGKETLDDQSTKAFLDLTDLENLGQDQILPLSTSLSLCVCFWKEMKGYMSCVSHTYYHFYSLLFYFCFGGTSINTHTHTHDIRFSIRAMRQNRNIFKAGQFPYLSGCWFVWAFLLCNFLSVVSPSFQKTQG